MDQTRQTERGRDSKTRDRHREIETRDRQKEKSPWTRRYRQREVETARQEI